MADRTFRLIRSGGPGASGVEVGTGVHHDDDTVDATLAVIGEWSGTLSELKAAFHTGGGMVVEMIYDDAEPPDGPGAGE